MERLSSLKTKWLSLLLEVSRWNSLQPFVLFFYRHLSRHLPIDRLGENAQWIAFHHPQPNYPLHILILPKQDIPSLPLAPADDPDLYADLFQSDQQMVAQFDLEAQGYRLITNGGPNQSIPLWHWHLISEGGDQPGEPHA